MRIGYILNIFPVLSESFIINEITALIDMGHEVVIFSVLPPRDKISHKKVEEYRLAERTHYFLAGGRAAKLLKIGRYSIGTFGWNCSQESLAARVSIPASKYFFNIARKLNLDLLHAHFNGVASHTAMLMAEKLNLPFTFTTHAIDIFRNPHVSALKKRLEKSEAVITISDYNRKYLHELTGLDLEKIHVVRACPTTRKIAVKKTKKTDCSIVTIARLVEK